MRVSERSIARGDDQAVDQRNGLTSAFSDSDLVYQMVGYMWQTAPIVDLDLG